jgi:hypothetical protein
MWTLTKIKTTDASADSDYKQQDIIIAFHNLYRDHTGAAQETIIRAVLNEYEIFQKLHCFVSNKVTNNNRELIRILSLHHNINISANNRICCAGHIINLVVKATIYGKGVSR